MIELDGTPNKGKLGANAILGVSLAIARAASLSAGLPLYRYVGGPNAHPAGADDEHLQRRRPRRHQGRRPGVHGLPGRGAVVRRGAAQGAEIFHALKTMLKKKGLATGVGDEGGFAPDLPRDRQALELITEAVSRPASSSASDSRSPRRGGQRVPRQEEVRLQGQEEVLDRR